MYMTYLRFPHASSSINPFAVMPHAIAGPLQSCGVVEHQYRSHAAAVSTKTHRHYCVPLNLILPFSMRLHMCLACSRIFHYPFEWEFLFNKSLFVQTMPALADEHIHCLLIAACVDAQQSGTPGWSAWYRINPTERLVDECYHSAGSLAICLLWIWSTSLKRYLRCNRFERSGHIAHMHDYPWSTNNAGALQKAHNY